MEYQRRPAENRSAQRRETAPHTRKRTPASGRTVLFLLGTLVLIGLCTALMIAGIFMKYVNTTLAPTLEVNADDYTLKLSSVVYYQDSESGEWVEFQKVHGLENRIWVDYDNIPDALWQAAVSIEDERFFQHNGVDWKRTIGATANMFIGMKNTFGGSTITQQMLKNMTDDNSNTVNRKVREIFRALEFEKNYTKEQILELYLNMIYLGQGCYGVQTAAEYYFGKDVSELDVAECASLIAITNNPSLYGPMYDITYTRNDGTTITPRELNKVRQGNILDKMAEVKNPDTDKPYLTEEEAEAAKAEVLHFSDGSTSAEDIVAKARSSTSINNWFAEQVIKDVARDLAVLKGVSTEAAQTMLNNGGYQIYTTMDYRIQSIAESVYENRENLDVKSSTGEPLQSGITIIDPYTGNVVAMVGCVGEKLGNLWTNYAVEQHQVGSSIKPLTVYSPALEAGVVTPATVFDNYPVRLLNSSPWPKNSPNTYTGRTTVADGVRLSINTIAVQTLEKLGVAESFAFATEKLNLGLVPDDLAVSPLGMGGLTYGLNTLEMAAAYASFANNGIYNSPKLYLEVKDANGETVLVNEGESHVAMKETTAYLMTKMLQSVISSGTGTSANFGGMSIAGKTGTTSDNRDRYFAGYTPYYCAAVWTGYRTHERISYSGNPSITMWKKVMQEIHQTLPNKSFDTPGSGLETITVCADSGLLCTDACHADLRGDRAISMTVATGTGPTESCTMHTVVNYCRDGQCLATPSCPAESVTQAAVLDFPRAEYFNADGTRITAEDDLYLLINLQRAIGAAPYVNPDGTEFFTETPGCTLHGNTPLPGTDDPNIPSDPLDPNDPNYIPPEPGSETLPGTEPGTAEPGGTEPGTAEPSIPTEPTPYDPEDDPTGGFGDASGSWWKNH